MRIVSSKEFKEAELDRLLDRGKSELSSIVSTVKTVIADVKEEGDKALLRYTEKFDKIRLGASKLRVSENEIKEAYKQKTSQSSTKNNSEPSGQCR
jgi:histidinol dehydrogenase